MLYRYIVTPLLLMLIGCGGNGDKKETQKVKEPIAEEIPTEVEPTPTTPPIAITTPTSALVLEKNKKTVTIYIHGYKEKGYKKTQDYGQRYYDTFKSNLVKYTELPTMDSYTQDNFAKNNFTNLITAVDYYGDTPPYYYTSKDLEDIEAIETTYDGGIPKYAHIVAKFAKNAMQESNASQINIVSVSMGSLVSRWLIEKNVEQLASNNQIAKWITVEGVIRGNYALSQVGKGSFLNIFIENSADTEHMKYQWITNNLNPTPSRMNSKQYQNIEVAQISLTNGKDKNSLLKYLLPLYGGFLPNDGFQLFKDTYFENNLSHTVIHESHVNVKNNAETFITINNFLKTEKRIQITLLNASLTDLHEEITNKNLGAEVVFESRVFSPFQKDKWSIEKPIDERRYKSGILSVYHYKQPNTTHAVNQILFDGFVDKEEKELNIFLEGFEIDNSNTYDIKESATNNNRDSIGIIQTTIKLKNGIYEISSDEWSGYIKVKTIEL